MHNLSPQGEISFIPLPVKDGSTIKPSCLFFLNLPIAQISFCFQWDSLGLIGVKEIPMKVM